MVERVRDIAHLCREILEKASTGGSALLTAPALKQMMVVPKDLAEPSGYAADDKEVTQVVHSVLEVLVAVHKLKPKGKRTDEEEALSSEGGEGGTSLATLARKGTLWKGYIALLQRWYGCVAAGAAQELCSVLTLAVLGNLKSYAAVPTKESLVFFFAQRLSATLAFLSPVLSDVDVAGAYFALKALRGATGLPHVVQSGFAQPGSAERFLSKSFLCPTVATSPAVSQNQSQSQSQSQSQDQSQLVSQVRPSGTLESSVASPLRLRYHQTCCDTTFAVYPPSRQPGNGRRAIRSCATLGEVLFASSQLMDIVRGPLPPPNPGLPRLVLLEFLASACQLCTEETGTIDDDKLQQLLVTTGDALVHLLRAGAAEETAAVLLSASCTSCSGSVARILLARVMAKAPTLVAANMANALGMLLRGATGSEIGPAVSCVLRQCPSETIVLHLLEDVRKASNQEKQCVSSGTGVSLAHVLRHLPLAALARRSDRLRKVVQVLVCFACRQLCPAVQAPPTGETDAWRLSRTEAVCTLEALSTAVWQDPTRNDSENPADDLAAHVVLGKLGTYLLRQRGVADVLVSHIQLLSEHLSALAVATGTPAEPTNVVRQVTMVATGARALVRATRLWASVLSAAQAQVVGATVAIACTHGIEMVMANLDQADFAGMDCGAPSSPRGHEVSESAECLVALLSDSLVVGMDRSWAGEATQVQKLLGSAVTTFVDAVEGGPAWLHWHMVRPLLRALGRCAFSLVQASQRQRAVPNDGASSSIDLNRVLNTVVPRKLMHTFNAMGAGVSEPFQLGTAVTSLELFPALQVDPLGALTLGTASQTEEGEDEKLKRGRKRTRTVALPTSNVKGGAVVAVLRGEGDAGDVVTAQQDWTPCRALTLVVPPTLEDFLGKVAHVDENISVQHCGVTTTLRLDLNM